MAVDGKSLHRTGLLLHWDGQCVPVWVNMRGFFDTVAYKTRLKHVRCDDFSSWVEYQTGPFFPRDVISRKSV